MNTTDRTGQPLESRSSIPNDLPDSKKDQQKMQSEEIVIDMPEVKDIPVQEHIHVPPLGELADITISSDDEEGKGILDELNGGESTGIRKGTSGDISRDELETLRTGDHYHSTRDEESLQTAGMDSTDFEGDPLNERSFGQERSGADLDVPGSEADDTAEKSGSEDEENNLYSLGGRS